MADVTQNASTNEKIKNAEHIISKRGTLIRHRFTVPVGDTDVETWVNSQSNLSFSLRMAIKLLISEFGANQDITCLGLPSPVNKVGRPKKDNAEAIRSFGTLKKPAVLDTVSNHEISTEQSVIIQPVQAQDITEIEQIPLEQAQEVTVTSNLSKIPSQVNPDDLGL